MASNEHKFNVNFGEGKSSTVDEITFKYLLHLEGIIKNQKYLPRFFNLANAIDSYDEELLDFYSFIFKNKGISKSQLFQDLFVLFKLNKKKRGTYLEFGATNGIELSNTYLLENQFEWSGVLAEPSPEWQDSLKQNRPKNKLLNKCIYSETGKDINFFVSSQGELSSIEEFKDSDKKSLPEITKQRTKKGYTIKVPTISLNDVFIEYFGGEKIDYMSVDTEGSEFLILSNFNFEKFGPKIVTVEHNFTSTQEKLDILFKENNYERLFNMQSEFDAWYVRKS